MSVTLEVLQEVEPYVGLIELVHNSVAHSNYDALVQNVELLQISQLAKEELLRRFPKPSNVTPPHWDFENEDEEFAEAYLRNPPDPGPLSQYTNHGWIDDEQAEVFRNHEFFKNR